MHIAALLLGLAVQQSASASPADSVPLPRAVVVRLVLGGSCESQDSVEADGFELELAGDATRRGSGTVRLARALDRRSESLQRAAGADAGRRARLEVDSAGTRIMEAALEGVTVQSYRLVATPPDPSADAQRLAAEETLAQLKAEQAEAVRALATTEALDRQKANAPLELPRARERVATITLRVRAQEERLAAIERSAARRRTLEERVTLGFSRMTLLSSPRESACSVGGGTGSGEGRRRSAATRQR